MARSVGLVGGSIAVVASVLVAATSWACVPSPIVVAHPAASGPPGTEITLEGAHFRPQPVEVRWNAVDGPLLATATGMQFAVKVTIPASPAGLYSIFVLSRNADAGLNDSALLQYQVFAPGSVPVQRVQRGVTNSTPWVLLIILAVIVGGLSGAGGSSVVTWLGKRRRPLATHPPVS